MSLAVTSDLYLVGRQMSGQSLQKNCENLLKRYKQRVKYVAKGAALLIHELLTLIFIVIVSRA